MTRVAAYCGPLDTRPNKCPLPTVISGGVCWHDHGTICRYYTGTTKDSRPGYGPVTVLCAAQKKKNTKESAR